MIELIKLPLFFQRLILLNLGRTEKILLSDTQNTMHKRVVSFWATCTPATRFVYVNMERMDMDVYCKKYSLPNPMTSKGAWSICKIRRQLKLPQYP